MRRAGHTVDEEPAARQHSLVNTMLLSYNATDIVLFPVHNNVLPRAITIINFLPANVLEVLVSIAVLDMTLCAPAFEVVLADDGRRSTHAARLRVNSRGAEVDACGHACALPLSCDGVVR